MVLSQPQKIVTIRYCSIKINCENKPGRYLSRVSLTSGGKSSLGIIMHALHTLLLLPDSRVIYRSFTASPQKILLASRHIGCMLDRF